MKRTRLEWETLACRRLIRVLARHGVANSRTLEQKISDAGPGDQRVDPHVLTVARKRLVTKGEIVRLEEAGIVWFHLPSTPAEIVEARVAAQLPVAKRTQRDEFLKRMGQTLEIALYRALAAQELLEPFGAFLDLDDHDDSTLYSKEEPPSAMGTKRIPGGKRVDFSFGIRKPVGQPSKRRTSGRGCTWPGVRRIPSWDRQGGGVAPGRGRCSCLARLPQLELVFTYFRRISTGERHVRGWFH